VCGQCPETRKYDSAWKAVGLSWWRGIVVIAPAYRKEDPGFESRQGARFLVTWVYIHCSAVVITYCVLSLCVFEKNKCLKKEKRHWAKKVQWINHLGVFATISRRMPVARLPHLNRDLFTLKYLS
jgi:hypothetical protein